MTDDYPLGECPEIGTMPKVVSQIDWLKQQLAKAISERDEAREQLSIAKVLGSRRGW